MVYRTGLAYDEIMLEHYCEWDDDRIERPDRIKEPFERCKFYGLVDKCIEIKVFKF